MKPSIFNAFNALLLFLVYVKFVMSTFNLNKTLDESEDDFNASDTVRHINISRDDSSIMGDTHATVNLHSPITRNRTKSLNSFTPRTKINFRNSILNSSVGSPKSLGVPGLGYDYTKSTEDNYCIDAPIFVGKYAKERSLLDYTYHKYYSEQRQLLHDELVDLFLHTIVVSGEVVCECPVEPWLVFTAGCMGAGKGHTIEWLYKEDLFPLNAFVRVDPDILRELLPETKSYIEIDPVKAGNFTQKEVGYIAEVLNKVALGLGKNVLTDGSLRNAQWYIEYITSLKREYKNLKIAIIYVTASIDTILLRARNRAATTGRVVPEDIILDTFNQLPKSIEALSPYVNYVAAFENENENDPLILFSANGNDASTIVHTLSSGNLAELAELAELSINNDGGVAYDIYFNKFDGKCHIDQSSDWKEKFRLTWEMTCPI